MADPDDRLPDNVPGKWYVDSSCIDCDVCRTTAPNNFEANEDEGYSFVSKQPENDEEIEQMEESLESCPVESIGARANHRQKVSYVDGRIIRIAKRQRGNRS